MSIETDKQERRVETGNERIKKRADRSQLATFARGLWLEDVRQDPTGGPAKSRRDEWMQNRRKYMQRARRIINFSRRVRKNDTAGGERLQAETTGD